ncbi:lipid A biosynthesis acyltransferase [Moraxella caviae]|nr:lysophospholipid acyltransferase family protein [Moraxella caviae]OOR90121.1 lipid A biosynthesis acyltransferase [Moraxella caviae]
MFAWLKFVPMSVLTTVARMAAILARNANASIYRSIHTNLALIYPAMPDDQRDALAKEALTNQLISTVHSAKSWAMPPAWSVAQIKDVHGFDILQRGLANPKGMLAVVPHIGTWEMMNAWINQFGKPTIMYKPSNNVKLDEFVLQGRQRLNATLVPTDGSGVKAIFKTLKQGSFSVVLPDHVPDRNSGEIAPFFGVPTLTGTLVPKLAHKTGCALVGLACIRRTDGQGFDVFCYDLADPNLRDADIYTATSALNTAMQRMIEPHLAHYMWGYRRFKFTPFGENPYLLPFDELHKLALKHHANG